MKQPGLFIGRFQPFHNGHLFALKEVLSKEEQLFIAIGSAQAGYTPTNPFTTAERIKMVQLVLDDLDISCTRYLIIPVPDVHNFTLWVDHVKRFVPEFGTLYTGSKISAALFSSQNFPVMRISLYKKMIYSGTEIRRRIVQDEKWKPLVPESVARLIEEIDGVKRLKSLSY